MENLNLNEEIIRVCLRIAKRGEGALIVLGESEYTPLVNQDVPSFKVIENPKLLESLALMDGAIVINKKGFMEAYGVKIKAGSVWKNFGTRHSAGISASQKDGNVVYVTSEEDSKVRVFKEGKLLMEIDSREKNIEKKVPEINKVMESFGYGTLGVFGAGVLAPFIGIAAIPGITVFVAVTGVSYFIKKMREWNWIK